VLPPLSRSIEINLGESMRSIVFEGKPVEMTF